MSQLWLGSRILVFPFWKHESGSSWGGGRSYWGQMLGPGRSRHMPSCHLITLPVPGSQELRRQGLGLHRALQHFSGLKMVLTWALWCTDDFKIEQPEKGPDEPGRHGFHRCYCDCSWGQKFQSWAGPARGLPHLHQCSQIQSAISKTCL
jgi:hypothetical protein